MGNLQINELLCFLSTQYDKLDRTNLNTIILEFYSREEVICAKNTLISACDHNGISNQISECKKNRIGTNVEQKVVKDILDIWSVIDVEKGSSFGVEFVAQNPNRLPSVNAEKYNLKFLISSILKLQQQQQQQQLQSTQQQLWLENIFKSLTSTPKKSRF